MYGQMVSKWLYFPKTFSSAIGLSFYDIVICGSGWHPRPTAKHTKNKSSKN